MPAADCPKPLALTVDRVDLAGGLLVFESLKKRRPGVHRAVPAPPALLDALDLVHGIRELQSRRGKGQGVRLWPWGRMTGWRAIHAVMQQAGLSGPHACPKGLRHGFGVQAVSAGIPLNLVQRWLGHAQLSIPLASKPGLYHKETAYGGGLILLARAQLNLRTALQASPGQLTYRNLTLSGIDYAHAA
jgi:integrase